MQFKKYTFIFGYCHPNMRDVAAHKKCDAPYPGKYNLQRNINLNKKKKMSCIYYGRGKKNPEFSE